MQKFKSQYAVRAWRPEVRSMSFVTDIRDLGLQDAFRASEVSKERACKVYQMAGPVFESEKGGKKEQASWIL